jgi:hypothetical protein
VIYEKLEFGSARSIMHKANSNNVVQKLKANGPLPLVYSICNLPHSTRSPTGISKSHASPIHHRPAAPRFLRRHGESGGGTACRHSEEGAAGPAPRFLRLRIPAPPPLRGERRRCSVPAQGGRRRRTRAARDDPTSRPHAVEPEAPPSSTPRPTAVELPFAVRLAAPPPPAGHHVRVLPSCVGGEGRQRARRSPHCNPCRIRGGEEAGAELQPSPPSRPPHRVPDASTSLLPAPGPPSSLGRPPCTEAPPPPNRAPCAGHPASAPPPEMEGPESWQEPPPICI